MPCAGHKQNIPVWVFNSFIKLVKFSENMEHKLTCKNITMCKVLK